MLTIKIYGIVNPQNDEVLYIGASKTPKARYKQHIGFKTWPPHTHRYIEVKKMLSQNIVPELLIIDTVDFPVVPFFEEFYIQLFKTWGYKIEQERSGYQTNKTFFNDNEKVYIPKFGYFGIVVHNEDELCVKVFIETIGRVMTFAPYEIKTMKEYNEANN